VLDRYAAHGWAPVVATELEFYLIDDSGEALQPALSPRSGKRRKGGEVLSMRALDAFDVFFTELYTACEAMGIPAEADGLKAADDTWLFKLLVRGLARKHGFAASFMAKPYPDQPGTGLHTHFSVLDRDGRNIFDDDGPDGTDQLRSAIRPCTDRHRLGL